MPGQGLDRGKVLETSCDLEVGVPQGGVLLREKGHLAAFGGVDLEASQFDDEGWHIKPQIRMG